jgi:hypothetical protein
MTIADIQDWATRPRQIEAWSPVDVAAPSLGELWREAVAQSENVPDCRRASGSSLTRLTKSLLRGEHLEPGDRHRLIFSAAANLAECGVPQAVVKDLLWDVARESGLPPKEITRQIECGFTKGSS